MLNFLRRLFVGILILVALAACRGINQTPPQLADPSSPASSTLELFVLPDAGSRPVLDAITSAQKSIRMTIELLTHRDVIDALKSARGRGVDVRIMIEPQPFGNSAVAQQTIKDLQAANVSVKTSNPAFRQTRQKTIVVDERRALIMSFNLTPSGLSASRGYGIIDSNAAEVTEIVNVFEADWKRVASTASSPKLVWSPVNARQRFLDLITSATKSLEIEIEEMQDKQIEDAIASVAQRGVQVRVIMSPATDATKDPNAKSLDRLKSAGVQVRLVKTPYVHAKMMIADNSRAFIGSTTISTVSLDVNRELGILVSDAKIVQTLLATFAGDWNIGK